MSEKHYYGIRKFNRAIFNPIMKLIAGRYFYSLVYHIGRRSGNEYSTPVLARKTNGFFFIPLPYGADTDWLLNVQAKGNCRVKMNGSLYPSTNPEIVEPSVAISAFSPVLQRAFKRSKVNHFLRLRIV